MALLMHPRQREYVADMVNEALIAAELEAGDSKEQPLVSCPPRGMIQILPSHIIQHQVTSM